MANSVGAKVVVIEMNTDRKLSEHVNIVRSKILFNKNINEGLSVDEALKLSDKKESHRLSIEYTKKIMNHQETRFLVHSKYLMKEQTRKHIRYLYNILRFDR